jgi:inositol hexakisphosphate/diphosphoinositol-pentakisphosphate kinase
MKCILDRLEAFNEFEVVIFGNETILNEPIDKWPISDCLISFFSSGFPLQKAEEYVQLRKPFLLNDIIFQKNLLNREKVSLFSLTLSH